MRKLPDPLTKIFIFIWYFHFWFLQLYFKTKYFFQQVFGFLLYKYAKNERRTQGKWIHLKGMEPLVRRRQPRIAGFFQLPLELTFISKNLRTFKNDIFIIIVVFKKFGLVYCFVPMRPRSPKLSFGR